MQRVQLILRGHWRQFHSNLNKFCESGESEHLHQARIGWRRLKSSLHFFCPLYRNVLPFPSHSLRPLLEQIGKVRDVDVALEETLPEWRELYAGDCPLRRAKWDSMLKALREQREQGRLAISQAFHQAQIHHNLMSAAQWIEALHTHSGTVLREMTAEALSVWTDHRLRRLYRNMVCCCDSQELKRQHQARLLAKQLRYLLESFQNELSGRWPRETLKRTKALQAEIGLRLDRRRAYELVQSLRHYPELADFIHKRQKCPEK
jgi:CHAD domain-containing protein